LVAAALGLLAAARHAFAVDFSRPDDGDVFQVLAPDERVVPVAMAEVLVLLFAGGVELGVVVVVAVFFAGADDGGALHQMKRDVAFEMDGDREVIAGGEEDGSAAVFGG